MEAQTDSPKWKRLSELQFEPGFTMSIHLVISPNQRPLDKEMALSLLVGIDKRHPWFPPSDVLGEHDPIVASWKENNGSGGGNICCTHGRSVIREKHLDAYLRYTQEIGARMFQYLSNHGVSEIDISLDLSSHVRGFKKQPMSEKLDQELQIDGQIR